MSDHDADMTDAVSRLPGLETLPKDRARLLAGFARLESASEGETFYRENDLGLDVFFLVSGLVEGRMRLPASDEDESYRMVKSGNWFGETSFLDGGRRGSTMVARERCLVLRFDGPRLMEACDRDPVLGKAMFAAFGRSAATRARDITLDLRNALGSR